MPNLPQNPANGTYLLDGQGPQSAVEYVSPVEVLKQFTNDGMPIVHVYPFKFACFSYLLFDVEEMFIDQDGQKKSELQLKIKNIGDGKFDLMLTNDNCAMERREEIHAFDHTTVDGAVSAGTSVDVVDASRLKGIGTSTRVRFISTASPYSSDSPGTKVGVVTGVSGNTLTLADQITLADGDKVYRGANLRLRCADIDNQYELNKRAKYESHFQTIQGNLKFETCELSKDRAMYKTGSGGPGQLLANAKVNALFENLLQVDFMDMWLYSQDRAESGSDAAMTRGILTTIQEAQVANGKSYVFDFQSLVGGSTGDSDEQVISGMIAVFVQAFMSGYYNNEPITAAINAAQLKHLMLMGPSFQEYFGIQMYRETPTSHEGCRDYVSLRVHGIEIEHGSVEFVLFEPFSAYFADTPIMLCMPKSMYGQYQRASRKIDGNMQVRDDSNPYPKFEFKDVTFLTAKSGGDECFEYVTKLEAAFAQAGIFNDAYYVIKNAKSYQNVTTATLTQGNIMEL